MLDSNSEIKEAEVIDRKTFVSPAKQGLRQGLQEATFNGVKIAAKYGPYLLLGYLGYRLIENRLNEKGYSLWDWIS